MSNQNQKVQVTNQVTSGGITFSCLLGIAFIVLKLCRVIDWPWIWVVCPFWIGIAALVAFFIILIIFAVIVNAVESSKEKKRRR